MLSKNKKAVFLDVATLGDSDLSPLSLVLEELKTYDHSRIDDVVDRCLGFPIVITNKVPLQREELANLPDLRLICVAATGMNNIDLEACSEMKIQVKNVSNYSTNSVAQYTFNLLFQVLHSNTYHDAYTKTEMWAASPIFTHLKRPFFELQGKTWGIIGLGNIGKRVAEIAKAFGCHVIYYSTSGKNSSEDWTQVSLDELMQKSDIISLHCDLRSETEGIINADRLKMAKRKPIIINTARGALVDEEDICSAIVESKIHSYAADVLWLEPPQRNHPFFAEEVRDSIFISPHVAWSAIESRRRLIEGLRKNILETSW